MLLKRKQASHLAELVLLDIVDSCVLHSIVAAVQLLTAIIFASELNLMITAAALVKHYQASHLAEPVLVTNRNCHNEALVNTCIPLSTSADAVVH